MRFWNLLGYIIGIPFVAAMVFICLYYIFMFISPKHKGHNKDKINVEHKNAGYDHKEWHGSDTTTHVRIILGTVLAIGVTAANYLSGTGFLESLIYGILTPVYLRVIRWISKNKDKKRED